MPVRKGYSFDGWYYKDQLWNFEEMSMPGEDIVLVARWIELTMEENIFTVRFESNGGSDVPTQSIKENEQVHVPDIPEKEGYTFAGWFLNQDFTEEYDFENKVISNLVLYARWIPVIVEEEKTIIIEKEKEKLVETPTINSKKTTSTDSKLVRNIINNRTNVTTKEYYPKTNEQKRFGLVLLGMVLLTLSGVLIFLKKK